MPGGTSVLRLLILKTRKTDSGVFYDCKTLSSFKNKESDRKLVFFPKAVQLRRGKLESKPLFPAPEGGLISQQLKSHGL